MTNPIEHYEKIKKDNNLQPNSFTGLQKIKNEYLQKYRTTRVPVQTFKDYSTRVFKRNAIQPTLLIVQKLNTMWELIR